MNEVSTQAKRHVLNDGPAASEVLGLAKVTFGDNEHPDERPCPPWCWHLTHNPNGYEHEIDVERMSGKLHLHEADILVRASAYCGNRITGDRDSYRSATLEPQLEQVGNGLPVIRVPLRRYVWEQGQGFKQIYDHNRLKLLVSDAKDLIVALQYLVDVAEGEREPLIEHQDCDCQTD